MLPQDLPLGSVTMKMRGLFPGPCLNGPAPHRSARGSGLQPGSPVSWARWDGLGSTRAVGSSAWGLPGAHWVLGLGGLAEPSPLS